MPCTLGPLKVHIHCPFLGRPCNLFLDETSNLCQVKLDSSSAWVSWQNFHGTSNIGPFLSHVTSNFARQYIASAEKYNWSFLGGTWLVGVAPGTCYSICVFNGLLFFVCFPLYCLAHYLPPEKVARLLEYLISINPRYRLWRVKQLSAGQISYSSYGGFLFTWEIILFVHNSF